MDKLSRQIGLYCIAIALTFTALVLMLALDPYLHLTQASFLLFFGAVTVSALYGGRGPGIMATLLSAIIANYFFLEPKYTFFLTGPSGARLLLFCLQGLLISWLVGALHFAQRQTRRSLEQLKASEAEIRVLNQALQHRLDELQTLFDVIPIGIAIAEDPRCQVVRANAFFQKIFNIRPDSNLSVTGAGEQTLPFRRMRNGKELQTHELPLQVAATQGVEVRNTEIQMVRPDGITFDLLGSATPLFNAQGNVRGSVAVFMDISDRKHAEQEREQLLEREQTARAEAERANQVKDQFLAVLSHELRSPLNPILGWSKLLQSGKLSGAKTQHALETIERNAKLQTQLIDDLLDVSRILRGKVVLNVTPVDLINTIQAAMETVQLAAEAKGIKIQTHFAENVGAIIGDAARLQQVIWNLLSNAIKFTPAGGRVEVRLREVGGVALSDRSEGGVNGEPEQPHSPSPIPYCAQIIVSDTGKGISPEFLPHVFEYFLQEDGKTTRKFGGLGLGLAIVRHITELHGGTVWAESQGEGKGATFTINLPIVKPDDRQQMAEESPLPLKFYPQSLKGVRILAVDDEADMRELVGFILQEHGAEVKVVNSAPEALLLLDEFKPDVLISDVGMPDMDGYMLMRQIIKRALEQNSNVAASVNAIPEEISGAVPEAFSKAVPKAFSKAVPKALALTAYAGEINHQKALAAGFQAHLSKPIEPDELIRTISQLLKLR